MLKHCARKGAVMTWFNLYRHTVKTGTEAAHCAELPPAQTGTTGTRVFRRVPRAVGVTTGLKMNVVNRVCAGQQLLGRS